MGEDWRTEPVKVVPDCGKPFYRRYGEDPEPDVLKRNGLERSTAG
jgi:hypothetical protein